jgi:hypothetical protein
MRTASAVKEFTTIMITLSAPETLTNPNHAYRYKVDLVSIEQELDSQEVPVPKHIETVDLCVAEPTEEAIALLLSVKGYLKNYQIVSYWVPEDCDCF